MVSFCVATVSFVAPSAAQRRSRLPACNENSTAARDLYICGLHAVESLQYTDAVRLFGGAYAAGHEPAALFNQGLALKSLGRFVEAREVFRRVLSDHPDANAEVRSQAETHLAQAQESIVRLRLDVRDAQEHVLLPRAYSVELNGRRVTPNANAELELDPGDVVLVLEAQGFQSARWEGSVTRGVRTVPFVLTSVPEATREVVVPVDDDVNDSTTQPTEAPQNDQTMLWVLLAGGVVVLASAAVVSYVLVSDREQQLQLRPAAEFRSTDVLRF